MRVVLLGADDFVAGFERQPVDDGVQRFGRVAVDGDLARLRAGQVGKLFAQRLAALVEDAPHVIRRPLVGELVIALDGLLHHDGRGRNAAVVEVDDVGVDRVRALDHGPEVFVLRYLGGAEMGNGAGGGVEVLGVGLVEETVHGERAGQGGCAAEEGAAVARNHTKNCRRLWAGESMGNFKPIRCEGPFSCRGRIRFPCRPSCSSRGRAGGRLQWR